MDINTQLQVQYIATPCSVVLSVVCLCGRTREDAVPGRLHRG